MQQTILFAPLLRVVYFVMLLGMGWISGCNQAEPPVAEKKTPQAENKSTQAKNKSTKSWSLTTPPEANEKNAIQVGEFEIIPPAEMLHIPSASKPGSETFVGPVREDKTYLTMTVGFYELPAEFRGEVELEDLLEGALEGVKIKREDPVIGEMERGTINGEPFIRAQWSGISRNDSRPELRDKRFHGLFYMGMFGNQVVQILFQDTEPDHAESLKLGEAALASFRKVK
jgi:hypothetical protein